MEANVEIISRRLDHITEIIDQNKDKSTITIAITHLKAYQECLRRLKFIEIDIHNLNIQAYTKPTVVK